MVTRVRLALAAGVLAGSACLDGDASYGHGSGVSTATASTTGTSVTSSAASSTASVATSSSTGGDGGQAGQGGQGLGGEGLGGRGLGGSGAGGDGAASSSSGQGGGAGAGGDGAGGGPLVRTLVLGGNANEEVLDARFAADGSIYVGGAFRSAPTSFGAEVKGPSCNGARRGYLLRLDATLAPEWVRCFGAGASEIVSAVFDGAGNAYVLGRFSGTMEFAGDTFTRTDLTLFVASLDATGEDRWIEIYPADAPVRAHGITRTPDALFITGSFRGEITLGAALLQGDAQYDGFLARVSSVDGSVDWALHQVESSATAELYPGSSPGTATLLLAGDFYGGLSLVDPSGAETIASDLDGPSARDVYLVEVDPDDGSVLSAVRRFGGPADEHVIGVDVNDTASFLATTFHGTVDPDGDGGPLPACIAQDGDALVVALDTEHAPAAALCIGGEGDQAPRRVATSRDGSLIAVGGDFSTTVDWGTGSADASPGADADAFGVTTDEALSVALGEAWGGGTGTRSIRSVDAQNGGRALFAGTFFDGVLLPDGPHTSAGGTDLFLILYDALP